MKNNYYPYTTTAITIYAVAVVVWYILFMMHRNTNTATTIIAVVHTTVQFI